MAGGREGERERGVSGRPSAVVVGLQKLEGVGSRGDAPVVIAV